MGDVLLFSYQFNSTIQSLYKQSYEINKSSYLCQPPAQLTNTTTSKWSAADVTTAPACALKRQSAPVESSPLFNALARRLLLRTSFPPTRQHAPAESELKMRAIAVAPTTTVLPTSRPTSLPRSKWLGPWWMCDGVR